MSDETGPEAVELTDAPPALPPAEDEVQDEKSPDVGGDADEEPYTWDAVFVFLVGDDSKTVTMKVRSYEQQGGGAAQVDDEPLAPDEDDSERPHAESKFGSGLVNLEQYAKKKKTRSKRVSTVVTDMTEKAAFEQTTADVVQRLEAAGLKTDMWYSTQKDEIYCRVGVTESRLMEEAERIEYDLRLYEAACIEAGDHMGLTLAKATAKKDSDLDESLWHHLYGRYDQPNADGADAWRQKLYYRYPNKNRIKELEELVKGPAELKDVELWQLELDSLNAEKKLRDDSLFTSVDRLKLLVSIIEADQAFHGAGISISELKLKESHALDSFFPLHENLKKQVLMKKWLRWRSTFWSPIDEIRDYFGEQIGLYFAFLQFYNRALVIPTCIGLIFFILQLADGRIDVPAVSSFAVFIALWATIFLEIWKRNEAAFRVQWGMTKFSEKEQPRPEFNTKAKVDPTFRRLSRVDGHQEAYMPWIQKLYRVLVSQTVIWTLIAVVIIAVVSIFLFRSYMNDNAKDIAPYVTGIVNAIQIQILNYVYGTVAGTLNEFENHRTDTEYENNLIAKNFLFKFVNSYNSFFYIAYIKRHDDDVDPLTTCTPSTDAPFGSARCLECDCLKDLRFQLATIFVSLLVINNTIEVVIPWALAKKAERDNRARADTADLSENPEVKFKEASQPEKEYNLAEYESTFDDFDELIVQFGFVTLFVIAFPIAPLAALANNVLETRVDATKLCKLTRRPEPRGASDIGTWRDILEIMSFISVITNASLVVFETARFTDNPLVEEPSSDQYLTFIAAEHIIILIKFAIAYFVPDESTELVEHRERQDYIVNVLINGMEDRDIAFDVDEIPEIQGFDWNRVSNNIKFDGKDHPLPPKMPGFN